MNLMQKKQRHNQPQRSNMGNDSKAAPAGGCKDLDGVAENQPTYRELIDIVYAREAEKPLPKPRVTSFVARDCSMCKALRDSDPATEGLSYSRMYAKVGNLRYCKCGYCGNTWKQTEESAK